MSEASPPAARARSAAAVALQARVRSASTIGSRRAAIALVALVLVVLVEGFAWATLQPGMSALAFWTCAGCHA